MGVLETVLNSRKFDLNDDVLMEFTNLIEKAGIIIFFL